MSLTLSASSGSAPVGPSRPSILNLRIDYKSVKSTLSHLVEKSIPIASPKGNVFVEVQGGDHFEVFKLQSPRSDIKISGIASQLDTQRRYSQFVLGADEDELVGLLSTQVIDIEPFFDLSGLDEALETQRNLPTDQINTIAKTIRNSRSPILNEAAVKRIQKTIVDKSTQFLSFIADQRPPFSDALRTGLIKEADDILFLIDTIQYKTPILARLTEIRAHLDSIENQPVSEASRLSLSETDQSHDLLYQLILGEAGKLTSRSSSRLSSGASPSSLLTPKTSESSYLIQIPVYFVNEETARAKVEEISSRFPSLKEEDGRKIKLIFGFNLPKNASAEKKAQMALFIAEMNNANLKNIEIVGFEWSSVPNPSAQGSASSSSAAKVNYVGIRNQLMGMSKSLIEQAVLEAKTTSQTDVSLITIDPDTKIDEDFLSRAEDFWGNNQPLVTAAHYKYEIQSPTPFESVDRVSAWNTLLVELSNQQDTKIKEAIASRTYLSYVPISSDWPPEKWRAHAGSNLQILKEFSAGLTYRRIIQESERESGFGLSEQIAQFDNNARVLINLYEALLNNSGDSIARLNRIVSIEKANSSKDFGVIPLLGNKISGETILYPNEAFLAFSVFKKSTAHDLSRSFNRTFWGVEGKASESQMAISKFSKDSALVGRTTAVKFIPGATYISETPNRHLEVAQKIVRTGISVLEMSLLNKKIAADSQGIIQAVLESPSQGALQRPFFVQRASYVLKKDAQSGETSAISELKRQLLLTQMCGHLEQLKKDHLDSAMGAVNEAIQAYKQPALPPAPSLDRQVGVGALAIRGTGGVFSRPATAGRVLPNGSSQVAASRAFAQASSHQNGARPAAFTPAPTQLNFAPRGNSASSGSYNHSRPSSTQSRAPNFSHQSRQPSLPTVIPPRPRAATAALKKQNSAAVLSSSPVLPGFERVVRR